MIIDIGDNDIALLTLLERSIAQRKEDRKQFEGYDPEDPIVTGFDSSHTFGELLSWIDADIKAYGEIRAEIKRRHRETAA
jgi:hypothetical protein